MVFVALRAQGVDTSQVLLFDLHTGAPRGSFDAGFGILTALVSVDRVYFGGSRGLLALRADGTLLFRAATEQVREGTWNRLATFDLVTKDASGRETSRISEIGSPSHADGLFVIGSSAAQPDWDT